MANRKHVAMLKKGVPAWNAWRDENPDVHPDLRQADVDRHAMHFLSGAKLDGADLVKADLNWAHLTGANLSGANLQSSSLVDTDLTGTDLTGCRIYGVSAWGSKTGEGQAT